MSEFEPIDRRLPPNVSTDSLSDVLSLESSHIALSKDESGEDLSDAMSSESSSEVGLSGAASVSGDGDSSPSEGPDCPFILPNE